MDVSAFDAAAFRAAYERDGYAVVRGVFAPAEVAALRARFDAWRADMVALFGQDDDVTITFQYR